MRKLQMKAHEFFANLSHLIKFFYAQTLIFHSKIENCKVALTIV